MRGRVSGQEYKVGGSKVRIIIDFRDVVMGPMCPIFFNPPYKKRFSDGMVASHDKGITIMLLISLDDSNHIGEGLGFLVSCFLLKTSILLRITMSKCIPNVKTLLVGYLNNLSLSIDWNTKYLIKLAW